MKREEILVYLSEGLIRVYMKNSKKEYSLKMDTSLFFKLGEISDVKSCRQAFEKISEKINFGLYYMRPKMIILYNDVCNSDIRFLYESSLAAFNYDEIKFVALSKLVNTISDAKNLVVADGECYTLIEKRVKVQSLEGIDFEPVLIGTQRGEFVHYSDSDIIWKQFKKIYSRKG